MIIVNEDPHQIRDIGGGPAGVGYSQATPINSLVSLKWRGTEKPCVTCRKLTHLWWVRRYSVSGFLDVGYALCQGDAKRKGGIYLVLLQKLHNRAREGERYVTVLVEEEFVIQHHDSFGFGGTRREEVSPVMKPT